MLNYFAKFTSYKDSQNVEIRKEITKNQQKNEYFWIMNWRDYIISDKEVLLGKPTIKGTRIAVSHIIGLLAQGWDEVKILENYPRLSKESLKAVFSYLQECIDDGLLFTPLKDTV